MNIHIGMFILLCMVTVCRTHDDRSPNDLSIYNGGQSYTLTCTDEKTRDYCLQRCDCLWCSEQESCYPVSLRPETCYKYESAIHSFWCNSSSRGFIMTILANMVSLIVLGAWVCLIYIGSEFFMHSKCGEQILSSVEHNNDIELGIVDSFDDDHDRQENAVSEDVLLLERSG